MNEVDAGRDRAKEGFDRKEQGALYRHDRGVTVVQ